MDGGGRIALNTLCRRLCHAGAEKHLEDAQGRLFDEQWRLLYSFHTYINDRLTALYFVLFHLQLLIHGLEASHKPASLRHCTQGRDDLVHPA